MADNPKGKEYVQIDLREPGPSPFVYMVDEDEEPACVVMQIFAGSVHVEMKADERALDRLLQEIMQKRIELSTELAFRRRSARVVRRKK